MNFKLQIIGCLIRLKFSRWLYRNNLLKLQEIRWLKMIHKLKDSPFYLEFVNGESAHINFPVMNKSIFMENFDRINTKGIKLEAAYNLAAKAELTRNFSPTIDGTTIGLSSGTSGNRGVFLASEEDRAQWVACILDRVIGLSLKKRTVAFFLRANSNLYDSVKSNLLSFEFFDLLDPIEKHIVRLNTVQPTILVAQPSLLLELVKKIESSDLRIAPNKVISVAEVLYPEDYEILKRAFQQTIHQVYQCTEGFLAATCKYGTLHFNEDFLIIEKNYIDDKKKRFHPIITDLIRSTQPVIRYELNDIIQEKKRCKCGSKMLAIKKIEGRSDDILTFRSSDNKQVSIFPDFFRRAIIMSDETIKEYFLVQSAEKVVSLFIDGDEAAYQNASRSVVQLLEKNGIVDVEIKHISSKILQKGTKLRRIQNDYRKTN